MCLSVFLFVFKIITIYSTHLSCPFSAAQILVGCSVMLRTVVHVIISNLFKI